MKLMSNTSHLRKRDGKLGQQMLEPFATKNSGNELQSVSYYYWQVVKPWPDQHIENTTSLELAKKEPKSRAS